MSVTGLNAWLDATVYLDIIASLSLQSLREHDPEYVRLVLDVALHTMQVDQISLIVFSDDFIRIKYTMVVGAEEPIIVRCGHLAALDRFSAEIESSGYIFLTQPSLSVPDIWGVLLVPIYSWGELIGLLEYAGRSVFTPDRQKVDFGMTLATLCITYLNRLETEAELEKARATLQEAVDMATRSINITTSQHSCGSLTGL